MIDFSLYALSAVFAGVTASSSTLVPHRVWGQIAFIAYGVAALLALLFLRFAGALTRPRYWLTGGTWVLVALVPMIAEAVQRASGRSDRAQEEVLVVEQAGARLLHTGSPYLARSAIAALPPDERLLGYTPYQPGMALFGLPRAIAGNHWWTDARVWFAVVTICALTGAFLLLRQQFPLTGLLRAGQAATVLPLCALTLATGGDDIPVLALSLLAIAFAARWRPSDGRMPFGRTAFVDAGLAIGAAGALKLFAWPVMLVLFVLALRHGRRAALSYAAPAFGLPVLALLPALRVNADALVENVVRFPGGQGLVTSPAQSPLPGHLIASAVPGGRTIALGLLVLAALAILGWLVRRPPRDAADAALVSAAGLTAAIMLTPTTRFGYLLYPVAYLAAWLAIRSREPAAERTQGT